jgi:hypothetical protein
MSLQLSTNKISSRISKLLWYLEPYTRFLLRSSQQGFVKYAGIALSKKIPASFDYNLGFIMVKGQKGIESYNVSATCDDGSSLGFITAVND